MSRYAIRQYLDKWKLTYSQSDPGQLRNLLSKDHADAAASFTIADRSLKDIVPRLDALVLTLKSCKGETCIFPWRVLHPDGSVESLIDSLKPRYDAFYHHQPKVSFSKCELGYIKESEGPLEPKQFRADESYAGDAKELLRQQGVPVSFRYQGSLGWWT
jgi:N-acetylglucosamine-6-sulfatase